MSSPSLVPRAASLRSAPPEGPDTQPTAHGTPPQTAWGPCLALTRCAHWEALGAWSLGRRTAGGRRQAAGGRHQQQQHGRRPSPKAPNDDAPLVAALFWQPQSPSTCRAPQAPGPGGGGSGRRAAARFVWGRGRPQAGRPSRVWARLSPHGDSASAREGCPGSGPPASSHDSDSSPTCMHDPHPSFQPCPNQTRARAAQQVVGG